MDQKLVRKIPGIGTKSEYILNKLEINTVKDLRENLYKIYITSSQEFYFSLLKKTLGYTDHEIREVKNPSIFKSQTFKSTKDHLFLINTLK